MTNNSTNARGTCDPRLTNHCTVIACSEVAYDDDDEGVEQREIEDDAGALKNKIDLLTPS